MRSLDDVIYETQEIDGNVLLSIAIEFIEDCSDTVQAGFWRHFETEVNAFRNLDPATQAAMVVACNRPKGV